MGVGVPDEARRKRDGRSTIRRDLYVDDVFAAISHRKPHHLAHRFGVNEDRVEIIAALRVETVAGDRPEAPDEIECRALGFDLRCFGIDRGNAALDAFNRLHTDLREFTIKDRAAEPFERLVFLEIAIHATDDPVPLGSDSGAYSQWMNDDGCVVSIRWSGNQSIALWVPMPPTEIKTRFSHMSPYVTDNKYTDDAAGRKASR